jgi:hypothetical protein
METHQTPWRRLASKTLVVALLLASIAITDARPATAGVCIAHSLTPVKVKTTSGDRVRFRGAGECTDPVKGIRVHIQGLMDGAVVNENNADLNKCGGPTSPAVHLRCPAAAGDYFAISTALRSGCHTYQTKVWIDIVWPNIAFWALYQDDDYSYTIRLGPGC